MTTGGSWRRQLESFIRHRPDLGGEWIEQEFTWAAGTLSLARSELFAGFQWLCLHRAAGPRIIGIRPFSDQADICRSRVESAGFDVQTTHHADRPSGQGNVEHFLVAQLVSQDKAIVHVCTHVPPDDWYVVDEHALRRRRESKASQLLNDSADESASWSGPQARG